MSVEQQDQTEYTLAILHDLFRDSCADVFLSLNCQVSKVDDHHPNLDVPCTYIQACSDDIELSLLLRGPLNALKQTYPLQDHIQTAQDDDLYEELYDWLSELANRFMGDLKNKLLPYEHSLNMGTPKKEFGLDVEHFLREGFHPYNLMFNISGELFECALYVNLLNENIEFVQQGMASASSEECGELELF